MIEIEPVESKAIESVSPPHTSLGDQIRSKEDRLLLHQVERILRSEELRGSEVLRRLLRFLAEKSISGEADDLKEYIIAIDGLGKPASYDPRHNSAVRIQVGRLRQKLADYFRSEGIDDPVIVEIPKGRFKLRYEFRDVGAAAQVTEPLLRQDAPYVAPKKSIWDRMGKHRIEAILAVCALLTFAAGGLYSALRSKSPKPNNPEYTAAWNSDLEELWHPFITASRPTIVAIEDPLFVELDGKRGVYYRDKTLNTWQDVTTSPSVRALRTVIKTREFAPSRYYTAFGEVDASFMLAKLLGSRVQNLAVLKTSNLSMRELTDNNVVFVGLQNIFFTSQIEAAPIQPLLEPVHDGIRNVHPAPHEPALFIDEYSTAPTEQGIAYALVTHVPGPMGGNDIESFTSSRSAGYVAAVKAFTDPAFVKAMVGQLKQTSGGHMPRYYQVLLKVKFTADEPTEITYVLARELHYPGKA